MEKLGSNGHNNSLFKLDIPGTDLQYVINKVELWPGLLVFEVIEREDMSSLDWLVKKEKDDSLWFSTLDFFTKLGDKSASLLMTLKPISDYEIKYDWDGSSIITTYSVSVPIEKLELKKRI